MGRFDGSVGPLRAKLEAVGPYLDGRQRRLLYAAEARQLGYGGIAAVAEAAGVSKGCVSRGLAELEEGAEPDGRVRRPGGGRPALTEKDPGLRPALLPLRSDVRREWPCLRHGQLVAHHFATVGDVRTIHDALVDDHLKLAQAVLDGDAQTAESLMELHLANVLDLHKEQLGDLLDGDVEWL
ncbi:hypothetical protein C1I97_13180 [Streptomyces sp. NTH33]|nr:hypothetical protein C1I97_13180 [Streptomyces sp. NTH33]